MPRVAAELLSKYLRASWSADPGRSRLLLGALLGGFGPLAFVARFLGAQGTLVRDPRPTARGEPSGGVPLDVQRGHAVCHGRRGRGYITVTLRLHYAVCLGRTGRHTTDAMARGGGDGKWLRRRYASSRRARGGALAVTLRLHYGYIKPGERRRTCRVVQKAFELGVDGGPSGGVRVREVAAGE